MTYSNREKADEARREVNIRMWVYSKRVGDGKMTRTVADKQIALMKEITDDYTKLADEEEAASRLI